MLFLVAAIALWTYGVIRMIRLRQSRSGGERWSRADDLQLTALLRQAAKAD